MSRQRAWTSLGIPHLADTFAIEILLSALIVTLTSALCIRASREALLKAKLVEAIENGRAGEVDLVERFALNGETDVQGAVATSAIGYEEFLSGRKAAAPVTSSKADTRAGSGALTEDKVKRLVGSAESRGTSSSQYVSSVRVAATGFIVAGTLGEGLPYQLSFRPAFVDTEAPFTYVWLCGGRRQPDGWIMMEQPANTITPTVRRPGVCRR